MKSIEKKLKENSYESIFISCVTIILGIIMIIFSNNVLDIISYFLGIGIIINGILKIFYYIKFQGKYNIFNYDLSMGILNIILGIICIIFKSEVQSIFRILIGIFVIYQSIINITLATKIMYVDKTAGTISLFLSILMIVCGSFIIMTKGLVVATIGYILIVFAIMDIVECIIFNRNLKKLEKFFNELKIK